MVRRSTFWTNLAPQAWPKSHRMQLNKGHQSWLAVGLQSEAPEEIKTGHSGFKGWCELQGDYNKWERRRRRPKHNADCIQKSPFSIFFFCTILAPFNWGFIRLNSSFTQCSIILRFWAEIYDLNLCSGNNKMCWEFTCLIQSCSIFFCCADYLCTPKAFNYEEAKGFLQL